MQAKKREPKRLKAEKKECKSRMQLKKKFFLGVTIMQDYYYK